MNNKKENIIKLTGPLPFKVPLVPSTLMLVPPMVTRSLFPSRFPLAKVMVPANVKGWFECKIRIWRILWREQWLKKNLGWSYRFWLWFQSWVQWDQSSCWQARWMGLEWWSRCRLWCQQFDRRTWRRIRKIPEQAEGGEENNSKYTGILQLPKISIRYFLYAARTLVGAAMTAVAAKAEMMSKNFIVREL